MPEESRLNEWRRGWPVLLGATSAVAAAGTLFSYSSSLFVKPLEAEFGWSRSEIAFGLTLVLLTVAVASPLVGSLTDRFGARRVGIPAIILYALCCFSLSAIPASLNAYYIALVATAIMISGTTAIVFAPLVVRYYHKSRGMALAMMMSGTALIMIPLSPLLLQINTGFSWRYGYALLGGLALFVSLPGALLAARQRDDIATDCTLAAPEASGMQLGDAIRIGAYWRLQGGIIFSTLPLGGLLNQIPAFLSDSGLSNSVVGFLTSGFAIFIILGRTVSGLLFDFIHPPAVAAAIMSGAALGCFVFAAGEPSVLLYFCAVALVGSAMGAEGDIQAFFVARHFGLRSYSAIFGTISLSTSICLGLGAYIYGAMQEHFGDYRLVLYCSVASFIAAALLLLSLGQKAEAPRAYEPKRTH